VESGEIQLSLRGHNGLVYSVVWPSTSDILVSGSADGSVRVWNMRRGRLLSVFEGHGDAVTRVAVSHDGLLVASKSNDSTLKIWRTDTQELLASVQELDRNFLPTALAFSPSGYTLATLGDRKQYGVRLLKIELNNVRSSYDVVRYRNAKVVLVGDSGVGKSGLGWVLAEGRFRATQSTHGRHVWSLGVHKHAGQDSPEEIREVLLWDLAGQAEYRVIQGSGRKYLVRL
jgi:WD40 repeat protein